MLLIGRFGIPVVMRIPEIIFDEVEIVLPSAMGKTVATAITEVNGTATNKTEVIVELPTKNAFSATKGYIRNKNYLNFNQGRVRGKRKW